MSTGTIEIKNITVDRLFEAAEFVVKQNFTRHLQTAFTKDHFELVRMMYEEEIIHYHQSSFFRCLYDQQWCSYNAGIA